MLSEYDDRHTAGPAEDSFPLLPWRVVACRPTHHRDSHMIGAQSALNRIQVWVGDLFIGLAAWRARRHADVSDPASQTDRQTYFSSM